MHIIFKYTDNLDKKICVKEVMMSWSEHATFPDELN